MDLFELRYSDYSLADEQAAVRDAFREFLAVQCPASRVRAAEPLGYDAKLWRQLTDLGAATMGLPEVAGGDGAGLLDLVIVAEEVGGALAPVPFAEHVAASRAIAAFPAAAGGAGTPGGLLADPAGRLVTLALAPLHGGQSRDGQLVPAGAVARDVLALDGDTAAVVQAQAPPPLVPNQGAAPLARWNLGRGARIVLGSGPAAVAAYQAARAEWKLLTAAALIGLTDRALSIGVEFARTRETLGVRIGTLQGVSFPLADVAIGIAGARNMIRRAAWLADNEPGGHPGAIEAAFAYAAAVATQGTITSAHVQGGLGFTIEADASLYFLRAKGWSVLGGDPARDVMAVADALLTRRQSWT
ncbi:MAG: Acyl-CoA dehydrogenase FadE27 [Actinomycetia bacterium]|nr:Acyl-CoA dehydrogenase FadE27 [Actinomycetes bacterium]